jgi:hypothetical protein
VTGASGIQGASGSTGLTGASGATGAQGLIGATGYGATGAHGATGVAGSTGAQGASGASGPKGQLAPWTVITAATGILNKEQFIVKTSSGGFSISLPASPTLGDTVVLQDGANWYTNNLTILPNGSTIEDQSGNLILDVTNVLVYLIYDGSTWQVVSTLGPMGASGIRGASGATGTQGASGVGATGAQGIQGASGSIGPTGATGSGVISQYWTLTAASGATGSLYISTDGVNVGKIDKDGNLTVIGNVTAYGSI